MHAIRLHRRDDADAIAEILAKGWAQAYSGFMPKDILTPRIDVAYRKAEIAEWLDDEFDPVHEAIYVAEDGSVDGFVYVELGDKHGLGAVGLINLLYVDPQKQGHGLGRRLMGVAAGWLAGKAEGPLALSAYADNPFRGFYDRIGGEPVRTIMSQFGEHELRSVLYLWRDPKILV